ncbi:hypothetical protein EB796_019158 [Bugula neritina]|uniref:Uncharacterized protein n=1 Tax=Bugula neritina TaxID=10212 RepID=A0A7J7J907_BUGNE|nr:hypothetical protein EB796_019158 [Bugula neritina]
MKPANCLFSSVLVNITDTDDGNTIQQLNYFLDEEDLLTSPSFIRVIENIGQLQNDKTFEITVVLVSEQNGEEKESDPVSTFFRTRMFTNY